MNEFFEWVRIRRNTASGRNLATKALGYAANTEEAGRSIVRVDLPAAGMILLG